MKRREQLFRHYEEQKEETKKRVSDGIERYRKGTAALRVTDRNHQPVPSVKINAVLQRHEFIVWKSKLPTDMKKSM